MFSVAPRGLSFHHQFTGFEILENNATEKGVVHFFLAGFNGICPV